MWLFDAPSGYHQLAVALASQEKIAFQGPDAIKWAYTVMPFGPTNGPATFINFIYDVDSQWKSLARKMGIEINDDTNTRIIVDDIVNHGRDLATSLIHGMPTSGMPGLLSVSKPQEKLHLPQAI
jgi:hypothetical protein